MCLLYMCAEVLSDAAVETDGRLQKDDCPETQEEHHAHSV